MLLSFPMEMMKTSGVAGIYNEHGLHKRPCSYWNPHSARRSLIYDQLGLNMWIPDDNNPAQNLKSTIFHYEKL